MRYDTVRKCAGIKDKEMAASVLEHRAAGDSLTSNKKSAVAMYNPSASPSRSLDVDGTPTANHSRYQDANCRLRLNRKGQPVAIRRVVSIGQPGSFASQRYQVVTPRRIVSLSHSALRSWESQYGRPVN